MKAISLLQPWASLVILGLKKIETRSFNTKTRGKILIHSSAKKPKKELETLMETWHMKFGIPRYSEEAYPLGAILGQVTIERTLPSENTANPMYELTTMEKAFGDYSCGRYGWELSNPIKFERPVPAKGMLGFWDTLNKKSFSFARSGADLNWLKYYGENLQCFGFDPGNKVLTERIESIINGTYGFLNTECKKYESIIFTQRNKDPKPPYIHAPGFCKWCGVHPCKC